MLNCQPCSSMTLCSCSVLLLHVYSFSCRSTQWAVRYVYAARCCYWCYPMHAAEKFNMVLAPTMNLDGTPDTRYYTQVINLAVLWNLHHATWILMILTDAMQHPVNTVSWVHMISSMCFGSIWYHQCSLLQDFILADEVCR